MTDNRPTGFVYDFANQPVTLTGTGAASFAYDGNFKRVKTVENGKTVYQVFSRVTGGLIYRDEATDGETTDYVSVGGAALRLKKGSTLTPEYTHFDHQGSALAATDAAGAVLWRERYSPWGTRLLKPPGNKGDTGYTGHLMDAATELVYMQARYYDSQIGRFYSTDPIGYQDQLNLYAYVGNDPVNTVDPNGEASVAVERFVARAAFAGGLSQADSPAPGPADVAAVAVLAVSAGALAYDTVFNNEQAKPTPLPEGLVGSADDRSETKGRVNSGPLAPESGGTGDAEKDFGTLTGGQSGAPPEGSTLPEGSRVGENGIVFRPGAEGQGPRIDVPASGDKPRETLHYPPPEVKDR